MVNNSFIGIVACVIQYLYYKTFLDEREQRPNKLYFFFHAIFVNDLW